MKYVLMILVVFLTACQSESSAENPSEQTEAAAVSTNAVAVNIEGKTLGIDTIDWTSNKAKITADSISLALSEKDNPLQLNLEVLEAGILAKGSATYVLPLGKKGESTVDLSFIDSTRPGLEIKQRVLFSEGNIDIKTVTANEVQVVFKGTGHALMDQRKFPIEGSVNVTF